MKVTIIISIITIFALITAGFEWSYGLWDIDGLIKYLSEMIYTIFLGAIVTIILVMMLYAVGFLIIRSKKIKPLRSNNPRSADVSDESASADACMDGLLETLHKDIAIKHFEKLPPRVLWTFWRHFLNRGQHWKISANVYHRLLLRHSILKEITRIEERSHFDGRTAKCDCPEPKPTSSSRKAGVETSADASGPGAASACNVMTTVVTAPELNQKPPSTPRRQICKHCQSYHIATTDVFVEKAIAYLEDDYDQYIKKGKHLFVLGYIVLFIGIIISLAYLIGIDPGRTMACIGKGHVSYTDISGCNGAWIYLYDAKSEYRIDQLFIILLRGITFYGMLVTFAVYFWRHGRANMDQAEKLREKRHALRQGRLFVHLNDGILTIEEMERAFNWNDHKDNAFSVMQTDANAPVSGLFHKIKEFFTKA